MVLSDKDQEKLATKLALEKELLKRSPYLLGKKVLGFTRYTEPHKQWDKWVRTHIDLTCTKPSKSLVMMPRETFKSTFFTVNLCISILLNNPNATILIASSTITNASSLIRQIKNIYERKEHFIELFGDHQADVWTSTELNISTRTNFVGKEANISCTGKGAILTSRHFDFIICDDLVSSDDRDSKTARDSTLRWFQDLWDLLKKDTGQLMVIGTPWHKKDLYWHIQENVQPALADGVKFNIFIKPAHDKETGELNFPTILTEEKLAELKAVKMGKDTVSNAEFMAQYELTPLSEADQVFKTLSYYNHQTTEYQTFIIFVDPALSKKESGDYSAIVVIGLIKSGINRSKWGICYASLDKRNATTLMQDVIRIHKMFAEMYKVDVALFMESNGFQSILLDNTMKAALEGDYMLPISPINHSENKQNRIAGMEPYFSQGFLLIRDDWKNAPEKYNILVDQLSSFPQGNDDGPDALEGAFKISRSRWYTLEPTEEEKQQAQTDTEKPFNPYNQ